MKKTALLLTSGCYAVLYLLKQGEYDYFLSGYLSDVLCIPLIVTWISVLLRHYYKSDFLPQRSMVWCTFLIVSVYFEGILPKFSEQATADAWDVLAYFAGTLIWLLFMSRKLKTEADLHPEF